MAFNVNYHRLLSDQESFATPLLNIAAGDIVDFSFATLSGFLGAPDLPVDGYLTLLVNGVELSPFTGGTTGSGSGAGTDFLFRQGTFSFSAVDQGTGNITLNYSDPNGSQQFIISGDAPITLSAHI